MRLDKRSREELERVVRAFRLRLVVLYGSRAKQSPPPGPQSDIDIAVLGCTRQSLIDCYVAIGGMFSVGELDLVRLEDADPLFRQEVMSQGVLLAGDSLLFCEYRAYAYRDFIDSKDLLNLERVLYRKKMQRLKEKIFATS